MSGAAQARQPRQALSGSRSPCFVKCRDKAQMKRFATNLCILRKIKSVVLVPALSNEKITRYIKMEITDNVLTVC